MNETFVSQERVRFADIDRAGIVYFPRFFHFFHVAFEELWDSLGLPYHRLIDERRIGFPIVHLESDFRRPLEYGDALTVKVTVTRIGKKSLTVRYRAFRETGELAAEARLTTACVRMGTTPLSSVEIPADLRAMMERYLEQP